MDKKAQSPIKLVFICILFIAFWALFLGQWLITVGYNYINANNATGIEALFYANLNFVVLIFFIIFIGLYGVFG